MSDFDEKMMQKLKRLEREVERLQRWESGKFIALTTPLTSTSWDGDARSTTNKTKIDLSEVFGVPAGVKAVIIWAGIRDSGSANFDANLELSPNAGLTAGISLDCSGQANDSWERMSAIVPCDNNGDIYYRVTASGTNTMDIYLQIWGWWL